MGLREGGQGFGGSEWRLRDGNGIQRWDSGLLEASTRGLLDL